MKDINYFIVQAANSTQREFELDYADVIEVFDFSETTLTTEEGRTLIITWCELGYFKSYHIVYETQLMQSLRVRDIVTNVIAQLKEIDVDGETMQYILQRVGMEEQMLKQLVGTAQEEALDYYLELRNIANK